MVPFFEKLLNPAKKGSRLLEGEEQRIAEAGSEKQRRALAASERTAQEVLYYLADKDSSDRVRLAVAQNPSTPLQAAPILANDKSGDVRLALARRLVKILPSLPEEKYSQLYAFMVQALGALALDEMLKIRKALAETLKDYAGTPPLVALQLAKDLEREVSEPILRFCTALSDNDLVDVLETHPAPWAAEAVARRKVLSEKVARKVIDTGNPRAGKYLLENAGADITVSLLETIVGRAREYPEWHKPIAMRKTLPPLMAMKLAAYADSSVRKILLERSNLDKSAIEEITKIIHRRVEYEDAAKKSRHAEDPVKRAQSLNAAGDLTEQVLSDAAAMRDENFVVAGLAILLKSNVSTVQNVFEVRAPKSICALCWKAGFSMRLAVQLQKTVGKVKPSSIIYPREDRYPFTKEELEWQLDVIGI